MRKWQLLVYQFLVDPTTAGTQIAHLSGQCCRYFIQCICKHFIFYLIHQNYQYRNCIKVNVPVAFARFSNLLNKYISCKVTDCGVRLLTVEIVYKCYLDYMVLQLCNIIILVNDRRSCMIHIKLRDTFCVFIRLFLEIMPKTKYTHKLYDIL